MPRTPWAVGNRRIPIAIQGGTAIKIASADPSYLTVGSSIYRDSWTGMVCTPTAARSVGDTTLTLNTPIQSNFESGAHSTTSRLVGLFFKYQGDFYRITAQAAAAITFVSTSGAAGLHSAMAANGAHIKIQAELPPSCSYLLFQSGTANVLYSYNQDTTAVGGSYFTLFTPQSQVLIDNEYGISPQPLFVVGSGADTFEIQVYSA